MFVHTCACSNTHLTDQGTTKDGKSLKRQLLSVKEEKEERK